MKIRVQIKLHSLCFKIILFRASKKQWRLGDTGTQTSSMNKFLDNKLS